MKFYKVTVPVRPNLTAAAYHATQADAKRYIKDQIPEAYWDCTRVDLVFIDTCQANIARLLNEERVEEAIERTWNVSARRGWSVAKPGDWD